MAHQWHYLENQFITATRDSYKKALKLSNFHDSALKKAMDDSPGDPDWATLYNRYHPIHLQYVADYNAWKIAGGAQKGETLNVKQLIALMTGKINNWDDRIRVVYPPSTPRYMAIFPQGHKPFQSLGIIDRINAIETLAGSIGPDAALVSVRNEVQAYYALLDAARDTQEGAIVGTKGESNGVDQSRIEAMGLQYADLGFLMNKLYQTPATIKILFDVETLTHPEQTIWRGHLDELEIHPTLVHTFAADDLLRLKSTQNADITVYLASTPGGTDSTPIVVSGRHERKIQASEFGITDYAAHRYLTIVNNSATNETRYLVELY